MKKLNLYNIFKNIFVFVVVFSLTASIAVAKPKVKSKEEARRKINRLKVLERVESKTLYKNQQKLETTKADLNYSQQKYSSTKGELDALEIQLSNALREYNSLDYQLKNRIRQIYKTQRKGVVVLLLEANNFNDFLDRIYYSNIILKHDYQNMVQARAKAKEIAYLKYNIEEKRKILASSIRQINQQQAYIQRSISRNENMINKLRTDRVAYEKAEKELARQSESIGTMISRSTAKEKNQPIKVVSGFIKPISGRITSPFGYRTHPIFNSRTFHSGVDIGGPYRGSIHASNSGKVIYTGWYGGYGKVVIIDHGNINGSPTTTLYAHMDQIKVSNGAYVTKGQVIGLEGTTGYSTGPHVHFEVRVNGKPRNPLNYI